MICWCRRDSLVEARKAGASAVVELPPAAVRRSRRLAPITTTYGEFQDPKNMAGDEEASTTQTTGEYTPG